MESVIDWINAGSTVAIALAAVVSAILSYHLFKENRLLRKAGTEPEVVAYLTMDARNIGAINFVLANIGQGPARNVEFTLHTENDDFERHDILLGNEAGRKAVSVLPQGGRIESFFGMGYLLLNEPKLRPFRVSVEFENIHGKVSKTTQVLDVSQFIGLSTLGKKPEVEIASSLKKIETVLRHASTGFRRLKVETLTRNEARKDRERAIDKEDRRQQKENACSDSDEAGG